MKKFISLALLASILLSTFACGGEAAPDETTASPSGDTTTEVKETDIYDALPQSDLGGKEIKIFGYGAGGYNYVDSEAFEAEQTGEPIDDAIY